MTYLPADGYCMTAQLGVIRARTDKPKIQVQLVRDPGGADDVFFSTTLYAFGNVVELYDAGRLIEDRFRTLGRITDSVAVVFDGVSARFRALYCSHDLGIDFDCTSTFWTSSATAVVHRNSAICLAHHDDGSSLYRVNLVGRSADGSLAVAEAEFTKAPVAQYVFFSVDEIIKYALDGATPGHEISEPAYFSISHAQLRKTFYIVADPFYLTFRFQNMFNAPEYIDVVGRLTDKLSVERGLAVCAGRARQYDRTINRSYEVQTGPLTADQALAIGQLIASSGVQLCAASQDYDVLITDHECSTDNDDTSLRSVKFTFRFAGNSPMILESELGALMPAAGRVFSQQFTAQFS